MSAHTTLINLLLEGKIHKISITHEREGFYIYVAHRPYPFPAFQSIGASYEAACQDMMRDLREYCPSLF